MTASDGVRMTTLRIGQRWRRGKRGKTYRLESFREHTVHLVEEGTGRHFFELDRKLLGAPGRDGLTLVKDVPAPERERCQRCGRPVEVAGPLYCEEHAPAS